MTYLSAAIVTVVAVECFCRLPVMAFVAELTDVLTKVRWVLLSKNVSDHWKEKVLLVYAGRIAVATGKIALALLALAALVLAATQVLDWLLTPSPGTLDGLMSTWGLTASLAVSVLYFLLRRRLAG